MNIRQSSNTLSTVPFRVEDDERIPAQRYYDESFYKMECDRLWSQVWQMACRLEQIPNQGDWVEYSHLGQSVIIVHTSSGPKAFYNACRHRGTTLVEGSHGNCKNQGLVCPFHGWRWNMDGKNTFVYGKTLFSDRQLDGEDIDLVQVRLEVAFGCVFINFDDSALSLRENLGPLYECLDARQVEKLRTEWWRAAVVPANWKVTMEAFFEGYHAMRTHPGLCKTTAVAYQDMYGSSKASRDGALSQQLRVKPGITSREAVMTQFRALEIINQGMLGLVHTKELEIARQMLDIELPENPEEAVGYWYEMIRDGMTKALRAKGEPVPDLREVALKAPLTDVEWAFPNFAILSVFSSFVSYRVRPLGPESCLFEIWSLTMFPEGEEPDPLKEPEILPLDSELFPQIAREDYSNIPRQQKGLRTKGFNFMRLSKDVEGMISNFHRLIDAYLSGVSKEKRAAANHLLKGNFDGPIKAMDLTD